MTGIRDYNLRETFSKDWPVLIVIIVLLAAACIIYPLLPERVPMHWNASGEVDGYGSRFAGAFAIPLMTAGIYLGMILLPLIDPRRKNYASFPTAYRAVRVGFVLFMAALYAITTAVALGYNINISMVMPVALGILFIIIGNFLTQVRHNYFVGFKTPWTLASEEVWRKTHRVGGYTFVIAGLISVFCAFLPAPYNFWVSLSSILGASLVTVVYSAVIFKR